MTKLTDEELAEIRGGERCSPWTTVNEAALLDHIAALQSELDDQRWRYVEDGELPEVGDPVLWERNVSGILTGTLEPNRRWIRSGDYGIMLMTMRAWRPLPKPAPERKKEDSHA